MKNVKTPFILRKGFVTAISIGFGAIMGWTAQCYWAKRWRISWHRGNQ